MKRLYPAIFAMVISVLGAPTLQAQTNYDGQWVVRQISCGDEPANSETRSLYTGGNSITVNISGETGAFVDSVNGCTLTIPLAFQYPGDEGILAYFNGPITCSPDACDPMCGLDIPVGVAYEAHLQQNTLRWESEGAADMNCTSHGQEDPVYYLMTRS
jgi:hypothetical protein